jgi:hypothetical protein
MKMTDKELLQLVGKKYTPEMELLMTYGGEISSSGRIARVVTKAEFDKIRKRCSSKR